MLFRSLNLNIAANYGGRWDITQSVQQLASSLAKGELAVEDITPDRAGILRLEGYRTPLADMTLTDKDTVQPEIHPEHHRHLVQWALHRGFSIPDMESFDPSRAALAEDAFTAYFGQRPDSDLRRITREDVPHHVEAFWP